MNEPQRSTLLPPHPGLIIREDIKKLRLTVSETASALEVNRSYFHKLLSGGCGVSAEMAIRLEQGIGRKAEEWLALQTAYDIAIARQRNISVKNLKL